MPRKLNVGSIRKTPKFTPKTWGLSILLDKEQKHAFTSGATSSEHKAPYDLLYRGALRRFAARFGLGTIKHARGNYLLAVSGPQCDVDFLRDRYSHAVDHLLSVKEEGSVPYSPDGDHLAAVGWFLIIAMELEEKYGIDWKQILTVKAPEVKHGKSR